MWQDRRSKRSVRPDRGGGRRRLLRHIFVGLILGAALLPAGGVLGQAPLFLGVTTSTENSGLLAHLVDAFEADHDIRIRAVTAGSGAVLNLGARGDVDVILVHSPEDEEAFVAAGYGIDRQPVMQNRFVIVGPKADPAGLRQTDDVTAAFMRLAEGRNVFLSRGDESGTHRAELRLWRAAGIDPAASDAGWYRESGSGQGATLNIAANTGAYTLTDEATWATFGNPGELEALFAARGPQPNPLLENVYSVIRVHPDRHAGLNAADARTFAEWLTSEAGQRAIAAFRADKSKGAEGHPLFRPVSRLAG